MKKTIAVAGFCALLAGAPAHTLSYAQSGTITTARNYTVRHPVEGAQGTTILQLSAPLEGGCTWAFINGNDKNALATLLAAKAMGAAVTVWYDNTIFSPWGDTGICAATGIQLN